MFRLQKSESLTTFSDIISLVLVLSTFFFSATSVHSIKCDAVEGLAGLGDIYDLVDSKISVLGFEASISYASLPTGKQRLHVVNACKKTCYSLTSYAFANALFGFQVLLPL